MRLQTRIDMRVALALVLLVAAFPAHAEGDVSAPTEVDSGDPWCWRSCWRPPNTFETVSFGLTEALTTLTFGSEWDDVTTFAMLMLVLLLRPRGLLGERVADKV